MRKFLLFSLLAVCVSNVFANMHQTGWRWRNDNGTETTATWKAADTIGITVTDTISLLRLRFRYDNMQSDPKNLSGIKYGTVKPAGDNSGKFDGSGISNGVSLSNVWGTDPFVLSTSAFVANGTATTQGQVKYMDNKDAAQTTFFIGKFISDNIEAVSIPNGNFTEFEYCFRPTRNLVPGATYYFMPLGDIEGYYGQKESPAQLTVSSPLVYAGVGHTNTITSDGTAFNLNTLLSAVGAINPSTITWSVATAPAHGNVTGFPATSSFTGAGVTPAGLSYTAVNGYSGSDELIVNVSDGTNTTAVTFDFTVSSVAKLSQTITSFAAIAVKTYGDAAFTVSATGGASGNLVTFTSSDPLVATCTGTNGTTITILKAGSCTIYADQAGNNTYDAASQVSQTLTIARRPITITAASGLTKKAGQVDPTLTYNITSGSLVSGDALTGVLTRAAGDALGTYAIQQGTLTNTNNPNYDITFVSANFTITPGTAVMSISANKPDIYPNPTTGLINLDASEGNVSVIGLNGQVILQTSLDKSKTIDISNFTSGIYILYLKTKDAVYEYKIVRK